MEAAFRGCIVITKGNEMTNEIAVLDQTAIATVLPARKALTCFEAHPQRSGIRDAGRNHRQGPRPHCIVGPQGQQGESAGR